ncbi:MAG: ATP-binding protein, partial [Methanococcaceae archaeon]
HKTGCLFYVQMTEIKFNDEDGNLYKVTSYVNITEKKYSEIVRSILGKITTSAANAASVEEIFATAHSFLKQLLPAKNLIVGFISENSSEITVPFITDEYYSKSNYDRFLQNYSELAKILMESARPMILVGDILKETINPSSQISKSEPLPVAILSVPLAIKNKISGIIILPEYNDASLFTKSHLEIFELIGQHLSSMVERRQYEEQLNITKRKAEESNRLKSAFLTQISHEIRTPVNTILSFSSLLKDRLDNTMDDEIQQCFDIIESGGRRLIRTIDLILSMSEIQSDSFDVNPTLINISRDILNPLLMEFKKTTAIKGLPLTIEDKSEGQIIKGDVSTITQVFQQIIDNAIKYTHSGKVEISLSVEAGRHLVVAVKDTGIGISEDYLSKLFTPFSQEEMGYTRSFEGNGLGLALVKKYAEINNATIEVESQKNVGTNFKVIFNLLCEASMN